MLQIQTTNEKNKLIGYLILGEITFYILKNKYLRKRTQKVEKHNNFTFHNYHPQFRF